MTINKILIQLANEPKNNAKIQILKDISDNELLKNVFQKALDPTINFYIKKIPQYDYIESYLSLEEALTSLDVLSSRKLTGNSGIDFLSSLLSRLSPDDASVLEKVILRDMRCGVSESTVNKIWKGLIPEYPYMRCSALSSPSVRIHEWDFSKGVFSQIKSDGRYNNCNVDEQGEIKLVSRSGTELPIDKFENIINCVKQYFDKNIQIHGELLVKRDGNILPREIGNGILNSISKDGMLEESDSVCYHIWDCIPLSESVPGGKYHVPYQDRFENLKRQCDAIPDTERNIRVIESKLVYNVDEAIQHFEEVLLLGLEGTVLKHPDAIWEDTTNRYQVKLKLAVDELDLEIVGFNPGKGKNEKYFGSILVKTSDRLLEVNISGFKDKIRKELSERRESLIGKIMVVKANCILYSKKEGKPHSLFLPRYQEIRDDKLTADKFNEIEAKFESSISKIRNYF